MTVNREQRRIKGKSYDYPSRIGNIGNAKSVWDNGLYATGVIEGVSVEFLVDSGSTATLLSKESFDKMGGGHPIDLHQRNIVMQGVDGKNINVYGYANINISFDGNNVPHTAIVCDIKPEGILGQDFLLKHVKMWDLDVPCLRTRQNKVIPLATGGETQAVCHVLVKDKMQIPPRSVSFGPVDIVNGKHLAANGYMEGKRSDTSKEQVTVLPGIVDPHQEGKGLAIMNKDNESITFYPCDTVATCNSPYEATKEDNDIGLVSLDCADNSSCQSEKYPEVPSHLHELFVKCSGHLNEESQEARNSGLSQADMNQLTDAAQHKASATTRNQARQQENQTLTGNQCLLHGCNATEVAKAQLEDPKIQKVCIAKRDYKPQPEWIQVSSGSPAVRTLWRQWDCLETRAGVLYRQWIDCDRQDSTLQLVDDDSKKHYYTRAKAKSFSRSQLVWLHDPSRKFGEGSKLRNHWKGPFITTRVLDDLNYLVKQGAKQKSKAYHIDRLWAYEGRHSPAWIVWERGKLQ